MAFPQILKEDHIHTSASASVDRIGEILVQDIYGSAFNRNPTDRVQDVMP
jgi:hypothetical protein